MDLEPVQKALPVKSLIYRKQSIRFQFKSTLCFLYVTNLYWMLLSNRVANAFNLGTQGLMIGESKVNGEVHVTFIVQLWKNQRVRYSEKQSCCAFNKYWNKTEMVYHL